MSIQRVITTETREDVLARTELLTYQIQDDFEFWSKQPIFDKAKEAAKIEGEAFAINPKKNPSQLRQEVGELLDTIADLAIEAYTLPISSGDKTLFHRIYRFYMSRSVLGDLNIAKFEKMKGLWYMFVKYQASPIL